MKKVKCPYCKTALNRSEITEIKKSHIAGRNEDFYTETEIHKCRKCDQRFSFEVFIFNDCKFEKVKKFKAVKNNTEPEEPISNIDNYYEL